MCVNNLSSTCGTQGSNLRPRGLRAERLPLDEPRRHTSSDKAGLKKDCYIAFKKQDAREEQMADGGTDRVSEGPVDDSVEPKGTPSSNNNSEDKEMEQRETTIDSVDKPIVCLDEKKKKNQKTLTRE
ncbi:hypothetical protein ElyMa_004195600 [Elysia marginata]|uniref:Uncharacterized protein n=1 Tax=Elysia marginata TaxID=1093978 RepID=A0AAV4GLV5_9GAST|nr:hypothetical protein ElyMa_004195600 [Elysia marginata]